MFKPVLKRAAVLFVTSLGVFAVVFSLLLWHHTGLVTRCDPLGLGEQDLAACYSRTEYFGLTDWPGLLALFVLCVALCCVIGWLWLWVVRKLAQRGD